MIEYKILVTAEERFNLVVEKYFEAIKHKDWEKVASLIELNPDIMAEGLELVYRLLPDEYKGNTAQFTTKIKRPAKESQLLEKWY